MTHQEFVKKYLWKTIDNDKAYWFQCVDLTHTYCKEVLWIDHPAGNAYDLWLKERTWYIKIANTLNNYPKQWDIIIFSPTKQNKYWHIAIVDNWNEMNVWVLEQNAWSGNWDGKWLNKVRLSIYNYITPKVAWRFRYMPWKDLIIKSININKQIREATNDEELKKRLNDMNNYYRSMGFSW